jgi:hypothetical protein
MKTPLKSLADELIRQLIVGLGQFGFEYNRRGRAFRKMTGTGGRSVRVGFIKHKTDFDVIMSVSVRIDALERLVYEHDPETGEKSYSLGAEIGNILEGKQRRWSVSGPGDLDSVSRSMVETLASVGVPYMQKHSQMEAALAALSGDDKASWLHSPVDGERAKRALGLAFLLGDVDAFRKLAISKLDYLKNRNDPKLKEFLVFKEKLESRL